MGKKILLALVERPGGEAGRVSAVNALRAGPDDKIEGKLCDGTGFLRGLQAGGHHVSGRRVLLLGAGGAGSAIASSLAGAHPALLAIHDPDTVSTLALAAKLHAHFPHSRIEAQRVLQPHGFDVVINASPPGLKATDPLPVDPVQLDPATLVVDIIMEPPVTRLLEASRSGDAGRERAGGGPPVQPVVLLLDAERRDGGYGYRGLRLRGDVLGTADGLAKQADYREGRRIAAEFTILEQHIGVQARPGATSAEPFFDSVGIGACRIDLHPSTRGRNTMDIDSWPFQIPLGDAVGQAAGTAAAMAAKPATGPAKVRAVPVALLREQLATDSACLR